MTRLAETADEARPRTGGTSRPLVAPYWRLSALVAVAACVAVVALLAARVWHSSTGTRLDDAVYRNLLQHVSYHHGITLLKTTDPTLTVALLVLVAGVSLFRRDWRVATLAVVAPAISIVLSEVVLKPLVDRSFGYTGGLAFPSGHETGLASLTVECSLLVLRARIPALLRAAALVLLAGWTVVGAAGLVRNHFHYVTDTIGAVAVCLAVVLGVAMLIDTIAGRSRPTRA